MSERSFYRSEAKTQITSAVKDVESKTAAEVEVAVRRVSGRYRDVDYLAGFAFALAALSALLFHPRPWAVRTIPIDMVVAFAVGTSLCAHFWNVRRLLVPRSRQKTRVREASLATFTELGVARTHGRHGILVYISLFERAVEVVPDIGIDVLALGPGWQKCLDEMQHALVHRHDLEAFCASLRSLGPVLGAAMPRTPDSVNELPDEPDSR
jgi:putative membrane protein